MTIQEAIKWFEENPLYHKDHEPFNMAISALRQCASDGDCISREMAIKALKNEEPDWESESYCQWEDDMKAIENLPSIEPKMGKWIRWYETIETKSSTDYIPHCKCSECGKEYDPYSAQFVKFCNECGAKMDGLKVVKG